MSAHPTPAAHPTAAHPAAAHPTAAPVAPRPTAAQTMDMAMLAMAAGMPSNTTAFGLRAIDLYRVTTSAAVLAAVGLAALTVAATHPVEGASAVRLLGTDTTVWVASAVALACIAAATGLASYAAKVVHEYQLIMRLAAPEKHEILTGLAYASVGTATLALGAAIAVIMAGPGALRTSAGVALAVALVATTIFQAVIASDLATSWSYVVMMLELGGMGGPGPQQPAMHKAGGFACAGRARATGEC